MSQKNREPGFYWVRFFDSWSISRWAGDMWLSDSDNTSHCDNDFHEIDERRITREEPTE